MSGLNHLIEKLPGGRLVRRAYVLVAGTAVAQAFVVVASPVLSRLYEPSDFGVFAVFSSLLGLGMVTSSLRYEQAINLPAERDRARDVLVLSIVVTIGTALIAALLLVVLGRPLVSVTGTEGLGRYLWLLPPAMVFAGAFQALTFWVVREAAFRRLALARTVQGATLVALQVGLGLAGVTGIGLVLGLSGSWLAGALVLGLTSFAVLTRPRRAQAPSLSGIWAVARRYRRFPAFGSWSALSNRAALDLPGVLFAVVYGPTVAGWFLLSYRLIAAPTQLISQGVGHVYLNEAAALSRDDPPALAVLYRRTLRRLLLIGWLPTVVVMVAGPPLFSLVFGDSWREAGVYAQLLAIAFLAQFTITPLTSTFAVLERQDLQLVRDVIRLVLVLGGFGLAAAADLSARTAVTLYGLSMAIGYLLLLVFGWREVHRRAGDTAGIAGGGTAG